MQCQDIVVVEQARGGVEIYNLNNCIQYIQYAVCNMQWQDIVVVEARVGVEIYRERSN